MAKPGRKQGRIPAKYITFDFSGTNYIYTLNHEGELVWDVEENIVQNLFINDRIIPIAQVPAQNADENQQLAPAISNSAEPNNNNVDDEAQEIGQDIKNDFDLMFDTNEERSNSNTFDEFDFFCF